MDTQVQDQKPAQLVNPPKSETKMIAQQKGQKTYKVFALREFQTGGVKFKEGQVVEDTTRIVKPGEIVEVTARQAKDLCKKIEGSYAFSGERHNADNDLPRANLTRARLATPADLVPKEPLTPMDSEDFFDEG